MHSALPPLPATDLTRFRWIHVKAKGIYDILAVGRLEADLVPAVTYRNIHTGDVWTRPMADFTDGRFERMYEFPAHNRVAELLDYNTAQVEKRRAACALLREASAHIDGTTGARSRPDSDSGEIVSRIDRFLSEIHK